MIPLAVPNLIGNEREYLNDCIDTTFVSSVGEYVNRFEIMVADATGAPDGVATSAGTTGLHAALTAVGVGYGELVIVPSFTFIASANSISHCGAIPWLFDVSNVDWCLDPQLVKRELDGNCVREDGKLLHRKSGRRVAAIMPVYTLGNMPDMNAFRKIADDYSLPLVVDAACAIGAKQDSVIDLAPLADLSVISFNGNKTVTCGGGGAVVCGNSDQDRKWLDLVRHQTTTARIWPEYDFDMVGFNYRMTNIQAAVGCAQMEYLDRFVETKRRIRRYYSDRLDFEAFPETRGSSCWFSGFIMPEGTTLDETKRVCAELNNRDVGAKAFWKPVHMQKPYLDCPRTEMTVSERIWHRIITLPCSTGITDEELEMVVEAVNDVVSGVN